MEMFAIALILLVSVILIVSLTYIILTIQHKEKMALLEKDLDPREYQKGYFLNTLKYGSLLLAGGLGFLSALYIDEYIISHLDNPAIYPGMILLLGGLSQIIFYLLFRKKQNL